jgi:hypothetical protein
MAGIRRGTASPASPNETAPAASHTRPGASGAPARTTEPRARGALDETDSDLSEFLSYLVAAIQTADTGACPETQELLTSRVLPTVPVLARLLANELDALEPTLVLVLDDYQRIAVDYTTAPFARWKEIQEQVISVFEALLDHGYSMNDIALYGDSAGGGLAISTVLNLRDRGMGMYDPLLKTRALAYADGLDLTDPRVSPLYGDFSKGFSPALITEGTKCILLSTSVRLFQALEAAKQEVKLDVYEGLWHVFQTSPTPETALSLEKIRDFLHQHVDAHSFSPGSEGSQRSPEHPS